MNEETGPITASMVVIGDEILSGRTKDVNVGHLADTMTVIGIDLVEVRMVSDDQGAIVEAVNALRGRTTYVFTTGGIGPTHDDITAEAVSAAFNLPCIYDERALDILSEAYASRNIDFTDARRRMARMPEGADLIENRVSAAPGFRIENVHVMAGVPKIMQAMLDAIVPTLRTGAKMLSESIVVPHGEGLIAVPLGKIHERHPGCVIGSYPKWDDGSFSTEIVVRSREKANLDKALQEVAEMVSNLDPSAAASRRTPHR